MTTSISVSANIPAELGDLLNKVSRAEERSKSYYIKKGLEQFLRDRLENLGDYEDAKKAHDEFVASGKKGIGFDAVFRDVK